MSIVCNKLRCIVGGARSKSVNWRKVSSRKCVNLFAVFINRIPRNSFQNFFLLYVGMHETNTHTIFYVTD